MSPATYHVVAERSGDWWAITVAELAGVFSQARRREQVESTAREAIALMLDIHESDVGSIEVELVSPKGVTVVHRAG